MYLKPVSLQGLNKILSIEQWKTFSRALHKSLKSRPRHKPFKDDFEGIIDSTNNSFEDKDSVHAKTLGVIVESRNHPNLLPAIKEVLNYLDISIQVFHGPSSKHKLLQHFSKEIESGTITLSPLKQDQLLPDAYNTLLMSPFFWQALKTRGKVLIFQCDAALCPTSPFKLDSFLQYDYIGSWWPPERPVGVYTEGGNGGFSLRDWHAHVKCIETFDAQTWPGAEDSFFAFYLAVMGANVATEKDTIKFGTQHRFEHNSFGAHKIGCLPPQELKAFLEYTPTSKRILDHP